MKNIFTSWIILGLCILVKSNSGIFSEFIPNASVLDTGLRVVVQNIGKGKILLHFDPCFMCKMNSQKSF